MSFIASLILGIWIVLGLYIGIGGLTKINFDNAIEALEKDSAALSKDTIQINYRGLTLENKYLINYYYERESVENLFPWVFILNSFTHILVTALALGMLGATISLLYKLAFLNAHLRDLNIFSAPFFGALMGLIVVGISYLVPTILVKNSDSIRPLSLLFLCLFGGIFSEDIYKKLTSYIKKRLIE